MRVCLVYHDNKSGLSRDAAVITTALSRAGIRVSRFRLNERNLRRRILGRLARLTGRPIADANLYLESGVSPGLLATARRNVLLANPDWMDEDTQATRMDLVLTKSRASVAALERFGAPVRWTRFTAVDRFLPGYLKENAVLHVAGLSKLKGTRAVWEAWCRHPEWPPLTIVIRDGPAAELGLSPRANIRLLGFIDDGALRVLQNAARIHLCPSEVEGFGHTIAEGMSCGALVVTTDAPPMNEIVSEGRGILIPAGPAEAFRLAWRHPVTADAVETAMRRVFTMDPSTVERLGSAAREWYSDNDRRFREEFPRTLEDLVRPAQARLS